MEATGRDGGLGSWSYNYLGQTRYTPYSSINSSSSGTVSTGYTFTGSYLSSVSMEAALATPLGSYPGVIIDEKKKHGVKSMVQEFFGVSSADDSGYISALKKWFIELDVFWLIHAPDGISYAHAPSWIHALHKITETIHLIEKLFPEISKNEARVSDEIQFAQFIQKTMLKMLAFVDFIVASNSKAIMEEVMNWVPLSTLLSVRGALSRALQKTWFPIHPPPSAKAKRIQREIVNLLSAKESKAGEAVWSTLEEIRNRVLISMEDGAQSCQSDIHKATHSLMRYISFLRSHYSSVASVVSEAASLGKYVPQIEDPFPLNSLIVEMVSCLEEKLVKMSGSFPDQGLGLLFLLNNSYFIRETLLSSFLLMNSSFIRASPQKYSSLDIHVAELFEKVQGYIESYLQVSWEPVLSCLPNPTHPRFWKRYSPLYKFESQFQKTYNTQMLWKVPDPKLRKTLRTAITEKIVPDYTKYIEDNNVTTPELTPQKLEEMLQELFEG
ncbi:unnamed protein product [Urochloa decumbens]|uniref:Exocyst subunit Exo70 family protein n=1 Tax=Urochloa decumbens TaxID=240449 RepID=A0ABC9BX91_9POAL